MSHDSEHAKRLAQNLVEVLAPYEEELMVLEREAPVYGPLRRAIGIAIAEACYCISDHFVSPQEDLAPPAGDATNATR